MGRWSRSSRSGTIEQRALRTGDPLLVRAAAAEMPRAGLDDALAICLVLLDAEPARYEPAAVRWTGRQLTERRGLTLADAEAAAANLAALADRRSTTLATLELAQLCQDAGLPHSAALLRRRSEPRRPAR